MLNNLFKKKHVSDESLSEIKRIIIESHKLSEDRHMLHLESVKAKEQLSGEKTMTKRLERENSDLKTLLNKALNNNATLISKVDVKKSAAKKIATTAAKTVSKDDEKLLSKSIGMMRDIKAKLTSAEKSNVKVKAAVKKLDKKVTKKVAVKKAPAKKLVAKKAAVKKVVAKKVVAKKVVTKKVVKKKVVARKAPAKKVVKKKVSKK